MLLLRLLLLLLLLLACCCHRCALAGRGARALYSRANVSAAIPRRGMAALRAGRRYARVLTLALALALARALTQAGAEP